MNSDSDSNNDESDKNNLPWVDKYRPLKIKELLIDDITMRLLRAIIEKRDMPNIIFTGIPGVGKTTTVKCLAKQLLGKNFKNAVLTLNTFDDRGIRVKEKISSFCQNKLIDKNDLTESNDNLFKIVILDEVDNMTEKAQQSVCELMDEYKKKVRFAFTCNDSKKITIIQRKCNIIRYSGIPKSKMATRLHEICKLEGIQCTKDGINIIAQIARGDMRRALNNLQIVGLNYGKIDDVSVLKICDIPKPEDVRKMINYCHKKNFVSAQLIYEELKQKGHSNIDILNSIMEQLNDMDNVSDESELKLDEDYKIKLMKLTADTYITINKEVNTRLQIEAYLARTLSL
jgi:replication factor C subunit 2/4